MEESRINIKDDYTVSMRCVFKGLMFSLVRAFREAVLFIKHLVVIPWGQPGYSIQFCFRRHLKLCWFHNVSFHRSILPRVLPSPGVTPVQRYYDSSDFLPSILTSSPLHLSVNTFLLERDVRISHVHLSALITCHALRPRECSVCLPINDTWNIAFWIIEIIGHSNILFSGLNHFSKCLRPAISLSTLNLCRYRHKPKTRYGMRWVYAFPVELSSTSSIGASWRTDVQVFWRGTAKKLNYTFI